MRMARLNRFESSDQGTLGILSSEGFSTFISELPWRDNANSRSCIPEGIYEVKWIKSPKFGWCYNVSNVSGRASILIHSGNFVGDVSLGLKSNSHGCLLPATKLGKMNGQKAGLMSVPAVNKLVSFFNKESFLLEIKNAYSSIGSAI